MDHWLFYLLSLLGALCFAVLFRVPIRFLPPTVILGFASCMIMQAMSDNDLLGMRSVVGSIFVGVCSQVMARFTGKPAQTFAIPSVIFLVPGRNLYLAFSHLLERDFANSFKESMSALIISIGISVGLMLSSWLVPSKKPL